MIVVFVLQPNKGCKWSRRWRSFFQPWKLNYRWIAAILLQIHQPPTSSKPAKCVVCWVCVVDCCVLVDFATNRCIRGTTFHRALPAYCWMDCRRVHWIHKKGETNGKKIDIFKRTKHKKIQQKSQKIEIPIRMRLAAQFFQKWSFLK